MLPSDIQDEAIPLILGGGDIMAAAETGSGAFLLGCSGLAQWFSDTGGPHLVVDPCLVVKELPARVTLECSVWFFVGKTGAFALPAIQIAHEYRRTGRTAAAASGVPSSPDSGSRPTKKARVDRSQLSIEDRSPMLAVSPDGLSCQCRQERDWAGVRSNKGVLRGKFYYEALICDDGLCRFGWSTASASLDLGTDRFGAQLRERVTWISARPSGSKAASLLSCPCLHRIPPLSPFPCSSVLQVWLWVWRDGPEVQQPGV
jgi:ATP-dependent RNA helicase DDX1